VEGGGVFTKASFLLLQNQEDKEAVRDRLRVWLEGRPWVERTKTPAEIFSSNNARVYAAPKLEDGFAGWGCALNILLAIATVGAWLPVAAIYYFYRMFVEPPKITFEVFGDGRGGTLLKVDFSLVKRGIAAERLEEIEAWLSAEFAAQRLEEVGH
jgi:hypothetical protein